MAVQAPGERPLVGIGVLVMRDECILLGERRGAHGAGTWAPPGGHLEYGETIEACAAREVAEETGMIVGDLHRGPYTADVFADAGRHYITLFVIARQSSGEPRVMEPTKCSRWNWYRWSELPHPLFAPLDTLHKQGFVPQTFL